jgi:hypothetical protein
MATICAQDVYVRCSGGGVSFGYLVYGQTIDVVSDDGTWAYGYCHGCVNAYGYVLHSAICGASAPGTPPVYQG